MRGMMVAFILLLIDIFFNIKKPSSLKTLLRALLKRSLIYLPALFIFILYFTIHYRVKGWIGFHKDSPWAECFKPVGLKGFIYNIGILFWRLLDFGRIGIWIIFSVLILKFNKNLLKNKKTTYMAYIFIVFLFFLPINMLWAKNLLGHRYLLPIYITFSLLTAKLLFSVPLKSRLRQIFTTIWILFLISGNFWVYPEKISQGWDSTLAHLPYYQLRKKTMQYIDSLQIDYHQISSFFPNIGTIDYIDLNNDDRTIKKFLNKTKFVIYSNVFNVDDKTLKILERDYISIKEFRSPTVYFKILKLKKE
jgi:hypothetical protein